MTQPTVYDPEQGVFYRTFNIRFVHMDMTFETPLVALSWREAEDMLQAIKETGTVDNELIAVA